MTTSTEMQARGATDPPRLPAFEPISITVGGIDPDRLMLAGLDTRANTNWPTFSVGEVAKFFFARSDHWVRWRETDGKLGETRREAGGHLRVFAPDGVEIGQRTEAGARNYSLGDVERMTHALLGSGSITAELAANVLLTIHGRAEVARLRTEADEREHATGDEPAEDRLVRGQE